MPREHDLYYSLTWGLELELTGVTRRGAAKVIAQHFGVDSVHVGTSYDKYIVTAPSGIWSIMSDASIRPLKKVGDQIVSASNEYRVELVTPVMHGPGAIDELQEVVRKLRRAGCFPSETCGMHIHVGIKDLPPKTLVHILNQVYSKQDLLFRSIGFRVDSDRYSYCRRLPEELILKLKYSKASTLEQIADDWYSTLSTPGGRYARYDSSRYHIVNLCRGLVPDSRFYLGTVEFRLFNSVVSHAGKLRAYIQLCLLIVAYCASISKSKFTPTVVGSDESAKYKFRCWLLKLNAIGPEFKTLRTHLLDKFGTESSAWRRGQRVGDGNV